MFRNLHESTGNIFLIVCQWHLVVRSSFSVENLFWIAAVWLHEKVLRTRNSLEWKNVAKDKKDPNGTKLLLAKSTSASLRFTHGMCKPKLRGEVVLKRGSGFLNILCLCFLVLNIKDKQFFKKTFSKKTLWCDCASGSLLFTHLRPCYNWPHADTITGDNSPI